MLIHYIKITIRNILANKFNYLLTTLGLAVGISIFAVIYFMVEGANHVVEMPNKDKTFKIVTIEERDGKFVSELGSTPFSVIEKLFEQKIPEIEVTAFSSYKTQLYSNEELNKKAIFETSVHFVNSNFFPIVGAEFIFGNSDSWDNNNHLVVLSEKFAKKVFGTNNPIGRRIEIRDNQDYLYGVFTVSGVIKPVYSYYQSDVFLTYNNCIHKDYVTAIVMLKNGISLESFNPQLKSISSCFNIKNHIDGDFYFQLSNFQNNKNNKNNNSFLIDSLVYLLASIVLIVALFNFFNFLIGSVQVRIRQFSLRRIVGANSWTFFVMFLCEIIPILLGALLGSYIFIELSLMWFKSSPLMTTETNDFLEESLGIFYYYPLKTTGWTLLVCSVIAFLLAQRIRHIVLLQGIRGKLIRTHRNYLRNI